MCTLIVNYMYTYVVNCTHAFVYVAYIMQDSALYNLTCLNKSVYCQYVIIVLGFLNWLPNQILKI